jgi:hypothetical protein
MSDLESYRRRTREAGAAFAALPLVGRGDLGPPDEKTGERWDRSNVFGHVAEMLPYWTVQVREVMGGATQIGRDEAGALRRREAIDSGPAAPEEELRREIERGVEGLDRLLDEMREEDLDRTVLFIAQSGNREIQLREVLDILLIGHLEAHIDQLSQLEG